MLAVLYNSPVVRLIPVGLVLIAIQNTLLVDMRPFGVTLQIVLAFAVSAGVAGGSDRGALAAFVLGVMSDLSLKTPLGTSAITFGIGAVVGGWIHLIRIEKRWWLNAIFVTIGSAVGELAVPVVKLMMGERGALVARTWLVVPVVAIGAGLISPALVPLARRVLRIGGDAWKPENVKSISDAPS